MHKTFAMVEFAQNEDEIAEMAFKSAFLRKSPPFLLDWAIKTRNPYKVEATTVCGVDALAVRLPMTYEDCKKEDKKEKVLPLIERTLNDLAAQGVDVVYPPKKCPFAFPKTIEICDGKTVFAFLIVQAMHKALAGRGKSMRTAQIVIIDGDKSLVCALIDIIYPHVNGLSLLTQDEDDEYYQAKADDIFSDTGLVFFISGKHKAVLENADVIINTSCPEEQYDFYYKDGAVYFELSQNIGKAAALSTKRHDIMVVRDMRVVWAGKGMDLALFETLCYTKMRNFRTFVNRGYRENLVCELLAEMMCLKVDILVLVGYNG